MQRNAAASGAPVDCRKVRRLVGGRGGNSYASGVEKSTSIPRFDRVDLRRLIVVIGSSLRLNRDSADVAGEIMNSYGYVYSTRWQITRQTKDDLLEVGVSNSTNVFGR